MIDDWWLIDTLLSYYMLYVSCSVGATLQKKRMCVWESDDDDDYDDDDEGGELIINLVGASTFFVFSFWLWYYDDDSWYASFCWF